ncbi:polyprenyl synthetase family protein [Mariniphaga sp.]|uniref:polyprenyl synthetase family protein n=1 Tax=Mariniphaga sp. TaxID=1954475 RepID=UPI00356B1F9B
MIEVNRILKVPLQSGIRNDLRKQVRLYVSANRISPPSNLETLEKSAINILNSAGLNGELLDFTMVLLGNEIWRETVMATPFHRRLLLLPQCLRNDSQCQGVFDELGLICSGCQGCLIDSILNRAEKLGYTTLVAEGTTVAIGLVEEGAIDAVIGVSCMSVLQRSFEPVTRAAVPAIGIPLLGDGCSNTALDYHWLFEEMENFNGLSEHTPLSVSLLKNQVADYFQPPVLNSCFNAENETEKLALKMMGMGGQRIRPLLSVLAYQSYSNEISENIQQNLALIIECFHKASLIHDDIEDDEETRYGQPVLHRSSGIPTAINVGDYLIGKGYRMLAQTGLKAEVLAECLTVVAESHVKLAEGQGADILLNSQITEKTVGDVLQIFRLKTGEAVKVALLTGAIAGEAPQTDLESLRKFSEYFGIAYQIRDDLNEFREENYSGNLFDYPFLLALLQEKMNAVDHEFPRILSENNLMLFRRNIEKFDIENQTDHFLLKYVNKCYAELDNLQNQKMRLGLYSVMGKVFKEQKRGQ